MNTTRKNSKKPLELFLVSLAWSFAISSPQQPTTNNQQPTTNNQQPTTNNQQPTTNNQDAARLYREKLSPLFKCVHPNGLACWSSLILLRLILPSLFPQYDKIISCDVDVVFSGDMSESYFLLGLDDPYYFAAAKGYYAGSLQAFIKERRKAASAAGLDTTKHFLSDEEHQIIYENEFNSGFMVVNLKAWRRDDLESKCLEFFALKNHALLCPEQDATSLLCHGHVLELPRKYNKHTGICSPDTQDAKEVIMWHFVENKPWKLGATNMADVQMWITALLRTPLRFDYFHDYYSQLKGPYPFEPMVASQRALLGFIFYKVKKKIKRFLKTLIPPRV
nr:glycosyltransferase [Helicobacter labacensis]